LACNNGVTPSGTGWTGRPSTNTSWTVPAADPIDKIYTIGATGTCGTVTNLTAACGTVKVSDIPACAYQPSWCGGIAINNVTTNVSNTTINEGTQRCIFIKGLPAGGSVNAAAEQFTGRQVRVNGTGINIDGNVLQDYLKSGNGKVDGGYYIYVGVWNYIQFSNATAGTPECQGFATTPSSSSAAVASSSSATVVASSSSAAGGVGGTISIATGVWNGAYNPSGGNSIPVGTYTTITCNNSGAPVRCYMEQNESVKVNGQNARSVGACSSPSNLYCDDLNNVSCNSITSLEITKSGVTCMNNW
jgi:hypothetical protein